MIFSGGFLVSIGNFKLFHWLITVPYKKKYQRGNSSARTNKDCTVCIMALRKRTKVTIHPVIKGEPSAFLQHDWPYTQCIWIRTFANIFLASYCKMARHDQLLDQIVPLLPPVLSSKGNNRILLDIWPPRRPNASHVSTHGQQMYSCIVTLYIDSVGVFYINWALSRNYFVHVTKNLSNDITFFES